MTSARTVKAFKTINSINKEEIDSIADDGFFTYGWFKTLETSQPMKIDPLYLIVYEADKIVAFAPCFIDKENHYFIFGPSVMPFMSRFLKMSNKFGLSKKHVLLCYSPYCYRTKVSLGKNLNECLVLNDLTKEIDAICKKEKILFSSFLFVSEFDKRLLMHLENMGYHKFFYRNTLYLDVRWRNFEDYLQSLKGDVRKNVRREIKSCKKNGVIIEEMNEFKDLSTTLSDLYSNLLLKYQKNVKSPFSASFYESLSDYAKDKTKVFIAKKKGVVIGFSICLRQGEILDVFHCGFNYDLMEKSDFVYFNIVYYEPIKWALQEGIRKIYYRITAEDVKYRRGCKPERVYSFVKCHNKFLDTLIGNYLKIRGKRAQALR